MKRFETLSLCVITFGGASLFAACGSDPSTLPYYGDTGTGASGGSTASAGHSASGGSTSVGGTGQGGTNVGTGGSAALGGTGGTSTGGTATGGTGGTLPMSTGGTSTGGTGGTSTAGMGGGGTTSSGGAGAASGAGGTFGQGGAAGTGFGFGGRNTGFGGRAGASAGGASGGATAGRGGSAGAMTGGAGSSGQTVTFATVGQFFNDTCGGTMCHGGKEMPSLVNTNPTTLYNTLKSTAVRQCGSDKLVTPNDTANSAILELVTHKCGTFVMPDRCNTNPCIDQSDVDMLTAWINEGAPGP